MRTREFVMKDLYTFDESQAKALQTYEAVRDAYSAFFNEFKIPYLTAEAASGDMGGDLSHEYHFPTTKGEDNLVHCTFCSYVINEELAGTVSKLVPRNIISQKSPVESSSIETSQPTAKSADVPDPNSLYRFWYGITKDRHTMIKAVIPKQIEITNINEKSFRKASINSHTMKAIFPQIDFSVESPIKAFKEYVQKYSAELSQNLDTSMKKPTLIAIFDYRIPKSHIINHINSNEQSLKSDFGPAVHLQLNSENLNDNAPNLVRPATGDPCPKCNSGTLKIQPAVELGHTFHLGTRYSKPLGATIAINPSSSPSSPSSSPQPLAYIQMGCHGIGVSRLIGAIADSLADPRGLNWPRAIAPFEAVIIPTKGLETAATRIYDSLVAGGGAAVDAVLDDRPDKDLGWKLRDADLIGYPVIVVVGRAWRRAGMCEVQCRRLGGVRVEVGGGEVRGRVVGFLEGL